MSGPIRTVMALSLMLQLMAAGVMTGDAGRGLTALCLNGQIVKVATGGPIGDPGQTVPDGCSLCGLALALVQMDAPLAPPPSRAMPLPPAIPAAQCRPGSALRVNPARAPPLHV